MATTTWSVRAEIVLHGPVSDDVVDELTDRLSALGAAVSLESDDRLGLQLTVEAGTFRSAFDKGLSAVTEATKGLVDGDLAEVQVLTQREFERRLDLPLLPEIWSTNETASFLGVSKVRMGELAELYGERLGAVKLPGRQGPRIFLANAVRRFEKSWDRRHGRRWDTGASKPAVPPPAPR